MKLKDSNPILPSHSPLLHTITRASQFHHYALLSACLPSHSLLLAAHSALCSSLPSHSSHLIPLMSSVKPRRSVQPTLQPYDILQTARTILSSASNFYCSDKMTYWDLIFFGVVKCSENK